MKLNILSDLHLGFGAMDWPVNDADVVVLAGDISRPREAVAWALKFDKPVLYVPGNHEFYGSSIDGALDELQRLCQGTQVQVLDNRELVMGGVRFLGSTLWTDFELFDDPQHPYTIGLMGSIPEFDSDRERLIQIDGAMPRLDAIPTGCAFNPRCTKVFDKCKTTRPDLMPASSSMAACWLHEGKV